MTDFSLTCIGILIIFTCLSTVWELVLWWYFRKWYIYYSSARYQSNKNVEITEMVFFNYFWHLYFIQMIQKKFIGQTSTDDNIRMLHAACTCSKWIQQNWISLFKQVTSMLVTAASDQMCWWQVWDIYDKSGHAFYVSNITNWSSTSYSGI